MTKVVYSPAYGGFGLSEKAIELYEKISGTPIISESEILRHDIVLVQVVEQLGANASSVFADLQIFEIPGCEYKIEEYDGNESVEYPEREERWVLVDTPLTRHNYPEKFL